MSDDRTPTGRIGAPSDQPPLSDAPTGQLRPPALRLIAAGQTDAGRVRTGNEDSFGIEPPTTERARAAGTLLIVSDGMGGHAAGEVASAMAVETVQAAYYGGRGLTVEAAIDQAIAAANEAIYASAQAHAEQSGMGCTIVAMVVQGRELTVGHVGDSRGYLVRAGRARQITRDHSWVAMQVEAGVLTPEQAARHPNRSLLMKALGRHETVEVEVGRQQLQVGDVLIICSDGLTGVVEDAEIAECATSLPPAAAAERLIALANSRGAPDNVTVVAAKLLDAGEAPAPFDSATTVVAPPRGERSAPTDDGSATRQSAAEAAPPADAPDEEPDPGAPTIRARRPGTPVVLSRESVPLSDGGEPGPSRRRYGRLIAGTLAGIGFAVGLALLLTLRPIGTYDAPRPSEQGGPTATPGTSGRPAAPSSGGPTVVIPPLATGLPAPAGATAPGAPAPPAPTATPVPTTPTTSVPTAQPTPAAVQVAPAIGDQVSAAATRAAEAAGRLPIPPLPSPAPSLPALPGLPIPPFGQPPAPFVATPTPTRPAATPTAPPTPAAAQPEQPAAEGGGESATDGSMPEQPAPGDDAPAGEEAGGSAGSTAETPPPSGHAAAPPPGGPRFILPDGTSGPAIPTIRPKPKKKDDD